MTSAIIGRVTRAPQASRRRDPNTRTFTVALTRRQRDKKQHWASKIGEVVVFCRPPLAERVVETVHRGDQVAVTGVLVTRSDDQPRTEHLVNVIEVNVIDRPKEK